MPIDVNKLYNTVYMYDVKRWGAIPAAKFIADKQEINYLQITKEIARSYKGIMLK